MINFKSNKKIKPDGYIKWQVILFLAEKKCFSTFNAESAAVPKSLFSCRSYTVRKEKNVKSLFSTRIIYCSN